MNCLGGFLRWPCQLFMRFFGWPLTHYWGANSARVQHGPSGRTECAHRYDRIYVQSLAMALNNVPIQVNQYSSLGLCRAADCFCEFQSWIQSRNFRASVELETTYKLKSTPGFP